jgi:hypothetical protein
MTDNSADARHRATKDALEKRSEMVNLAMVSLLAVSPFCLLTTLVTGHKTRAEFDRYHIVSPAGPQEVARRIDSQGAPSHYTAL